MKIFSRFLCGKENSERLEVELSLNIVFISLGPAEFSSQD